MSHFGGIGLVGVICWRSARRNRSNASSGSGSAVVMMPVMAVPSATREIFAFWSLRVRFVQRCRRLGFRTAN